MHSGYMSRCCQKYTTLSTNFATHFKQGQFREGKVKGGGLVTFPDGSHGQPRNEGRFEDQACVERRRCAEAVERARQSSAKARTLAEDIHCTDGD